MGMMHIPGHEGQKPREVSLEEIRSVMGDCRLCQLCQTRTNIVFGVGNPHARVLFVGEAPGKNEDLQGEPFVGRAGENLNRILSLAGLRREDIYIANVLKCRPPGNRNPAADEVLACSPYLREQIRSIWPDIIVTLGNPASHFVLKTETGITKLRGRFHQMGHFTVMPTFHPAAALRNPAWQQLLEADFKMLGDYLAAHPAGSGLEAATMEAAESERSDALPSLEG
ncbi:MAG: uracil-DNA glycosylase [Coriobacteriaceae bacterium]|nr:uracil-DNA glycosylase [Coriobacteriaceae bacterium]